MSTTEAPSSWRIERTVALAQATLDALREEHGQIIESDAEILEALLSEGVDAERILSACVAAALEAKANAAAADARLDNLKARRDRFEKQEETWRGTILAVMQALDLRSYKTPEAGLSVRPGAPKLMVTDETIIPDELITTIVTHKPDKVAIKAALERGDEVPGCVLSNGGSVLAVRTR
jgi:hypothetical protein